MPFLEPRKIDQRERAREIREGLERQGRDGAMADGLTQTNEIASKIQREQERDGAKSLIT